MKKLILLFLLLPTLINAQSLIGGKNIIKANLSSLALGNYHLTYERAFLKRMSLSISYRTMPKKSVPLQKTLENYINDPNLNIGRFELGNTAITPELRIYIGTGKMKGFYVAPYARFATFDFTVPVKYQTSASTAEADFVGTIKSTSGGMMIGTQHQILKKLVLDIWIIGGHFGSSTGNLLATFPNSPGGQLSPSEKASLEANIAKLNVAPFKIKGTVASDLRSATIISDGPWAGIRGLGISLGLRF